MKERNNLPANVETMVSGRGLIPWHKLGVVEPGLMTAAQAYELGGLNWSVEVVPQGSLVNGQFVQVPDVFNVIRNDTGATIGTSVTDKYKILQNDRLFYLAEEITGKHDQAVFDTAGVLDGGKRVWAMCHLVEDIKIAGDAITPYFLITSGHDGKNSLIAIMTGTRVVCWNTLTLALREAERRFSVKHMGTNMTSETLALSAQHILGMSSTYYSEFEKESEELLKIKVPQAKVEEFVNEILFPEKENLSKRGETLLGQARDLIWKAINASDLENVKNTGWGLYQAVADYNDHMRTIKKQETDPLGALERSFLATFDDNEMKDEAHKFVLSLA